MKPENDLLQRFHRALVESIRSETPSYLYDTFTVAEIYQALVPYRTHRDRLGIEMNGDYEDALLRLLAGEGDFLILESEPARNRIRRELEHRNPNTGIYREFAAVEVRLNPNRVPDSLDIVDTAAEAHPERLPADETEVQTSFGEFDRGEGATAAPDREASGRVPPQPPSRTPVSETSPSPPPSRSGAAEGSAAGTEDLSECPECGDSLPDRESLKFCPHCGTNVLVAPCDECGEILEREWKYCLACGVPTGS